jgi:hypothetical protein
MGPVQGSVQIGEVEIRPCHVLLDPAREEVGRIDERLFHALQVARAERRPDPVGGEVETGREDGEVEEKDPEAELHKPSLSE